MDGLARFRTCFIVAALCAMGFELALSAQQLKDFGRDGLPIPVDAMLFPIKLDGRYGFIDQNGNVVTDLKYRKVCNAFNLGYAALGDNGWVLVNLKGEHNVFRFSQEPELMLYVGGGLFFGNFKEGDGRRVEYCDLHGNFPANFDGRMWWRYSNEDLLPAEKNDKWGFVRRDGSWAIKPRFVRAYEFADGVAAVCDPPAGGWGYMDRSGSYVIEPRYADADRFSQGVAVVRTHAKRFQARYIRIDGTDAFPGSFFAADTFSCGLARVKEKKDGLWGYIDRKGKYAIPPQFTFAYGFSCGLAAVQHADTKKWSYIDLKGQTAIEIPNACNHGLKAFYKGLAHVYTRTHEGYVGTSGKWIWQKRR